MHDERERELEVAMVDWDKAPETLWRIVHAATGMEMYMLDQFLGMEPKVFKMAWRMPPGGDFTLETARALARAYMLLTEDYGIGLEPVDNEG